MQEHELIETFANIFGNTPYLADAEILPDNEGFALYSVDSFSEREDFFQNLTPWQIGHQMAYAACSDILACGALPECLLQSWSCDSAHDLDFYKGVSEGVNEVLTHYGAKCIGGDIGIAQEWIWTTTITAHASKPIKRVASQRIDFDLYSSGPLGEANAAVFCGKPLPIFQLRQPVPLNSIFATDTSGGLIDTLENIRRVNHGLHLDLDVNDSLSPKVQNLLPAGVQAGWTLVGGIGEYELLFAIPSGAACHNGIKIGSGHFSDDSSKNQIRLFLDGNCGILKEAPPDYRDVPNEDWLSVTAEYWASLFK